MGAMTGVLELLEPVGAAVLAAPLALASLIFPVRAAAPRTGVIRRPRVRRALVVFAVGFVGLLALVAYQRARPYQTELTAVDAADVVPGLLPGSEVRGAQVSDRRGVQTFVRITAHPLAVRWVVERDRLAPTAFFAHLSRERGWRPPDWWPTTPCGDGVGFVSTGPGAIVPGRPSAGGIPPSVGPGVVRPPDRQVEPYVLSWCPAEQTAFVQRIQLR